MTALAVAAACLSLAAAAGPTPRTARAGATARGPERSVEELAEAQVREREAVVDARERRARAGAERLDAGVGAALDEARRIEERERRLVASEKELDAREQRLPAAGAPSVEQRRLEALEADLASQERQLGAQERSFTPAVEAAARRERDGAARAEAEAREARRAAPAPSPLERRRRAVGEQEREVAALEEQLLAMGDRLEALERQLRARGERLEARGRRLDARAERLELVDRQASAAQAAPPSPVPRPDEQRAAGRERAPLALVVKTPTTVVMGASAGPGPADASAARHPGLVVDKTISAAAVVGYASPSASLSELDLEGVDRIAKIAARERCELLIWARARDAAQLGEAQRRASELRNRAVAAGPLDGRQVVTRLTTRPGSEGVDVVISALRERGKPAAAAAATPVAALQRGEGGKRQIREAVQAAKASIEACVGDHLEARRLRRAEGVLKLTVSGAGKVDRLESGGDLAGTEIEDCLVRAAPAWTLPGGEAGYAADVPIAVFRGAARTE